MAHVEKILGFSTSSSITTRQPLGASLQRENTAKPCSVGEWAAASHQSSTDHRVASPERRSRRVSIPSRRFLKSSAPFLLNPAISEGKETLKSLFQFSPISFFFQIYDLGFGWKPTLILVDLVREDQQNADLLRFISHLADLG